MQIRRYALSLRAKLALSLVENTYDDHEFVYLPRE